MRLLIFQSCVKARVQAASRDAAEIAASLTGTKSWAVEWGKKPPSTLYHQIQNQIECRKIVAGSDEGAAVN